MQILILRHKIKLYYLNDTSLVFTFRYFKSIILYYIHHRCHIYGNLENET